MGFGFEKDRDSDRMKHGEINEQKPHGDKEKSGSRNRNRKRLEVKAKLKSERWRNRNRDTDKDRVSTVREFQCIMAFLSGLVG